VFWVGKWFARRISNVAHRAVGRAGADAVLAGFIRNMAFGLLLAIVAVAALDLVGVPSASMLAALGAAGLAIGLALQGSLANLASGVILIAFRPFSGGDYVEIADVGGSVRSVGLLFTTLVTPDNREVVVPNGEITKQPITNFSTNPQRRVDLLVGVGSGAKAQHAIDIIRKVLADDARVLAEPEPQLLLMNLNESSVDIAVRPWVKREDYWTARSDLLIAIKSALDDAGIEIPFPQRTVHVIGSGPRQALSIATETAAE
jgi:small conductance mechanosensitive channel